MREMSTRPSTRADRALATRRRIVRTAYDLFSENGYLGTTMSAVAQRAGVAVPTMYYTFGTKARLLEEALGAAIVGFARWREAPADPRADQLLPWLHWWHEFEASPTSRAALDTFVSNGVGVLERVAPLVPTLHGAAGDLEAAQVVRVGEQRRVDAYRQSVRIMAGKQGGLRPGVTPANATDILVVLFSAELYQSIRIGRGWSASRTEAFLRELLVTQLLPPR